MSDNETRRATTEEALHAVYENTLRDVARVLEEGIGGSQDFETLARDAMAAAGWAEADGLKMWDPLAVVATKADLVVVLDGLRATVLRKAVGDAGTLERPGHHVSITWGNGGRAPKWVSGLTVSKIDQPE